MRPVPVLAAAALCTAACGPGRDPATSRPAIQEDRTEPRHVPAPLVDPREVHLTGIEQLTFDGENAEAYFDSTGTRIVLQARKGTTGFVCDQIFEIDLGTRESRLVSTGRGRTTCAYYHDDDRRILYSSTHLLGPDCPPEPGREHGYVWPLYDYDIFSVATHDPTDLVRLTRSKGYDAEATVCPAIGRILFTSVRDGDIELYSMKEDGTDLRRLTHRLGYDGGAFYSADGSRIVWRAQYPESDEEKHDYLALLRAGLVRPSRLDIWVANADGGGARQLTDNGKANFAPFFFPDGRRVIWSANLAGPREFHLYVKGIDGRGFERITYSSRFNSFPMFSPDGRHIVFASNRNNKRAGDTNIFLAQWRD